ncbi:uncharacterized protein LOC119639771 isoform X3 [Glossina fuscipes]|uniref:Uncharacterized protein LOC119639771 isoform X3 n=1 Tax=Glossina fuscipes TaxID=7396 RepID=A0A9C5ZFC3_9MUSC|nr:uncharacterized protein LOC119639771 isoform X3 [Glossina fuscipes]
MVDLTDSSSPYQQSIPNLVFYVPAVVVFSLAVFFGYKLYVALKQRELRKEGKLKRKEMKKTAKTN